MMGMSIAAVCDSCGKQFEVNEALAGKKAKCSNCGHLFRIPEGPGGTRQGTRVGDPSALSKGGSTVLNAASLEKLNRMKTMDPDTLALESISFGRPRDEGTAELIDHWIPRTLTWVGIGGSLVGGIMTAHQDFRKHLWVGYSLMAIVALLYWQMAVPLVVKAVRKAERHFHFELPTLTRTRLAVTFGVPTAFGYFFYAYAGGASAGGAMSAMPAVAGMFFGLFAAFFVMWAVLHLDFQNASMAFACATIAYLVSVAFCVLVLYGYVKGLTILIGPLTA